jgi:selenoprotein W-related protein
MPQPRPNHTRFIIQGRNKALAVPGGRREAPGTLTLIPAYKEREAMTAKPRIEIEYCTQCRWLLRAAWLAQELLTTFEEEIGEVALIPGTGGIFEVRHGNTVLWSRKGEGRFPEAKELKQRVKDEITPEKHLGHSDKKE